MATTADYGAPTDLLDAPSHSAWAAAVDTDLATKLDVSGGTMTGDLALPGAPTSDLHAVPRQMLDRHILTAAIGRYFLTVPTPWIPADLGALTEAYRTPRCTKLSVSNGNVVVGAGVRSVYVSANLSAMHYLAYEFDKAFSIRVDDSAIVLSQYWTVPPTAVVWVPCYLSQILVPVSEGTIFDLVMATAGTGPIELLSASLTVEVVD